MEKKKETINKENVSKVDAPKDKPALVKGTKEEAKFVDVPLQVVGEFKQKKYVELGDVKFSPDRGNIFFHLDDKHILLLKGGFLKRYLNLDVQQASEVEKSIMRAPEFSGKDAVSSTVRLKYLGESDDGKVFVGPKGPITYEPLYKGIKINLDDQCMTIIDGHTLSREVGIKIVAKGLENKMSMAR